MKRFLIFIIPVLTIAAIISEHSARCQSTSTIAGQMPICE